MQRMNRMVLGLVAVFVLGGSLALLGCSSDDEDTTDITTAADAQSLLANKSFTFTSAGLDGIPVGTPITLQFNGNASRFSLAASGRRATGAVSYSSCVFTVGPSTNPDAVGGGSNFSPGTGPQPNEQDIADPCTFNSADSTLTVTIGGTTTTSGSSGTATGTFGG